MSEPRRRRVRIDVLLVDKGLAPSRAKAQALVMAGLVATPSGRIDKVGTLVDPDADITVSKGTAAGSLLVYPKGQPSTTPVLSWTAGQTVSATVLVAPGQSNDAIFVNQSTKAVINRRSTCGFWFET